MFKAILTFLIPAILVGVAIFLVSTSKEPEVVKYSAVVKPGYETSPEHYNVTASSSLRWEKSRSVGLLLIGYLFFVASAVYVYHIIRKDNEGSLYPIGLFWLIGIVLIFGRHSFTYYQDGLTRTISAEQYEKNKSDLDKIFER